MAGNARGKRRSLSSFEIAFGIVLLAGLPLATLLPRTLDGKFHALIAAFAAALAAGAGYALLRRRPQADFDERYAAAPPGLLDAIPAPAAGGWSLELLRRLDPGRFEALCAAAGDALDAPPHALCTRAGNAISVGLAALRAARADFDTRSIDAGVFVTAAVFSEEAIAWAAKNRIRLVDGAALLQVLEARLSPERCAALLEQATRAPR